MEAALQRTVLFANVIGGAELRAKTDESVLQSSLSERLEALSRAAESCGAWVVKTLRDRILVIAETPDSAADAAATMHDAMAAFPAANGTRLLLGVGFHHGPVIRMQDDVFGATVNLAARLAEQAAGGNILTTQETALKLCALYRSWMRQLYAVRVRGVAGEVELCELLWRKDVEATAAPGARPKPPRRVALLVKCDGRESLFRRNREEISIGRDGGCDLVIADPMASRQHCTIERRVDRFVLTDHSANGTYVCLDGEPEAVLHRGEMVLHRHGWISLGQPRTAGRTAMEFEFR